MNDIIDNIGEVRERVRKSAEKVGRDPDEIKIVAVTKTVPVEKIKLAVESGLTILGENRVQELLEKDPALSGVEWHLIGHLQTNKVKYIVDKVSMLHSLDSIGLAGEISKRMNTLGRVMEVLVQVNVAGEESKFGIKPSEAVGFVDAVRKLPGLKLKGLMTIAPMVTDPEETRPVFRQLKNLAEEIKTMGYPEVEMSHLSMGMSNDYKVAVEEGATLIRLGSTIFGSRN